MPPNPPQRECLSCHGTNIVEGRFGSKNYRFMPVGRFMWLGYAVKGFACLDCGMIGHRLDMGQVADIKQRAT
jgi:hypothetical protein